MDRRHGLNEEVVHYRRDAAPVARGVVDQLRDRLVRGEPRDSLDAAAEGLHVDRSIGSHSRLLRGDVRKSTRAEIEVRRLK